MLKLRLQRRGKKNYATYRVVVAEDRAPIKGRFIADVGYYNPHTDDFSVDKDVVTDWVQKGVQPTPTVHNLLIEHKIISGEKVTSWRAKKQEGAEDAAAGEEQPAAAPEEATPAAQDESAEQAE